MSDSLPVYTDTHAHKHTHTHSSFLFRLISVLSLFFAECFISVLIQKRRITNIFPHRLTPLLLVAAGATSPVEGIRHPPDFHAHRLLPETRDVAGVAYRFQAFSMQLHPTSNQQLDANSKSSYLMLMVLVVAPTNMHVRASQRPASRQVRMEVRAVPHGHFGPPVFQVYLLSNMAILGIHVSFRGCS